MKFYSVMYQFICIVFQAGTLIFTFNQKGLRKSQYLNTPGAIKANSFKVNDDIFLIITNSRTSSKTYLWTGKSFIEWVQFDRFAKCYKTSIELVHSHPIFFVVNTRGVLVYDPNPSEHPIISKIGFEKKLNKIISYDVIESTEFTFLFVTALSQYNQHVMYFIPFTMSLTKIPQTRSSESTEQKTEDYIASCFNHMNNNLLHRGQIVEEMWNMTNDMNEEKSNSSRPYPKKKHKKIFDNDVLDNEPQARIINLNEKIEVIKNKIDTYSNTHNIDGNVIIQGNLNARTVETPSLITKNVNDKPWDPSKWLLKNKTQIIPINSPNFEILAKNLDVTDQSSPIYGTVMLDGDQTFTSPIYLSKLKANNINVKKINNLDFDNIYLKSKGEIINGEKVFQEINADKIILNEKEREQLLEMLNNENNFDNKMHVENLNVQYINKMDWQNFVESVLVEGENNIIQGNVRINSDASIENLKADTLSSIDVNRIVTTSTNQVISSDFQLFHVNVDNIISDNINGIDFSEDVATAAGERIIKGPVSIKNMDVIGNLTTSKEIKVDEDLVDTDKFFQNYNGHVKIVGDLFLNKLNIHNSCNFYHQDNKFNFSKLPNIYWMKNVPQIIHQDVRFSQISTEHLSTLKLNNINVESYIKTTDPAIDFKNLTVEQLTVFGNMTTNIKTHDDSFVKRLITETVKKDGFPIVGGHKVYQNELTIDKLESNFINGELASSSNVKSVNHIILPVHFSKVIIKKNVFVAGENYAHVENINNVNLQNLKTTTVFINQESELATLSLVNITTTGVEFQNINDVSVDDIVVNVTNLYNNKEVNSITLKGNAEINEVNVKYIKNLNIPDYFSNLVFTNSAQIVTGAIKILGKPFINSLHLGKINDLSLDDILNNYLSRNRDQSIRSVYHFNQIASAQFYTPGINEFSANYLINKKNDKIYINGTLHLNDMYVERYITTSTFNCDISKAAYLLKSPVSRYWPHITADNAFVKKGTGILSDIIHDVVHKDIPRPIFGDVTLDHLSAEHVILDKTVISGFNFKEIIEDAVMSDVPNQVITGYNTFNVLYASDIAVTGNANITKINKLDILDLNASIIYEKDLNNIIIHGNKVFSGGLFVKKLKIPNTIHDILPTNLITLSEVRNLPNAHFTNLTISNNINFDDINGIPFVDTLKHRLLVKTEETQYISSPTTFDYITVLEDCFIESINGIKVKDMVTDDGIQLINGNKKFTDIVHVSNDLNVDKLNGYDINAEYLKSPLIGEEMIEIPSNIIFEAPIQIIPDVNVSNINGVEMKYLDYLLRADKFMAREQNNDIIFELEQQLKEVQMSFPEQEEYMYVEQTYNLEISIPNSVNAHVLQIGNNIQLNIIGQNSGENCGLAQECFCPTQFSLQLTPHMSYENLVSNDRQRLFSFYENGFNLNLVTESVSSSHLCRLTEDNEKLETTYLMWQGPGQQESFFKHIFPSGYVRDAKFFSRNYNTYLVVVRFYEPMLDSHNLDCVIMKSINNGTDFATIQTLKTSGAWALEVFETAQGVILVIGNVYDTDDQKKNVDTEIYRFVDELQQFALLRSVATKGCTAVTGITLEDGDSLIILAEYNHLIVFKYHPDSDNYLFFQSLRFESSVLGITAFRPSEYSDEILLASTVYTGHFYIHSFKYIEGWKLKFRGNMDGLQILVPFTIKKQPYFFAPSTYQSKILKIATQGLWKD